MTLAHSHVVRIRKPFYLGAASEDRCGLHRYFEPNFMQRFKQDLQRRQFTANELQGWQEQELRSPHGREPVLRLPLHRTFHLVSGELVCERLGWPALDPRKIASAGFVIRRQAGSRQLAWMLADGEATGWQDVVSERDPDVHRRLCKSGVLHERSDAAAYSGEEVYPLHVLTTSDAAGKLHTLLYGYLPLGGFYYHRDAQQALDASSQEDVVNAAAAALPWPFGYNEGVSQVWTPPLYRPITRGRPSKAMFELLRVIATRYHVGEAAIVENKALERHAAALWFYDEAALPIVSRIALYAESEDTLLEPFRARSLADYLHECFARGGDNPLTAWIVRQERAAAAAGGLAQLPQLEPLPNSSGGGDLNQTLRMQPADAQELRTLLGQRVRDQASSKLREIPLPKFTQGAADLYQVVPFVRSLDADGRETLHWADSRGRSIPFRVSAPFDPEATRPALIQIPSLADLKRGLAKGASMITPADTFSLINSLKLDKGVTPDLVPGDPGPNTGIQWICSFSIPVITVVAMILLMIMVTLLNFIFFWMPWVRICLPFPKLK